MYYAAQDILEYLMNSVGGGAQDGEHRLLRAAVHHAYRDVMNARDWNFHVATGTLDGAGGGSSNGVTSFTLPENVKNIDSLIPPMTYPTITTYVTPSEWQRINVMLPTLNAPIYWTVMKDPSLPDRWQIRMAGAPPDIVFNYVYRRRPVPLRYLGYEPDARQPNFSVNGAVRRYGTAANYPEGLSGLYPFTAQEIIGLSGSLVGTPPTGAKTVVSDYVDASDSMFTAILSGCEAWLARMNGKNVEGALTIHTRDLRMAFEADSVVPISGQRTGGARLSPARALGYYSPPGADTGVLP
jgi:hypothetical protein